MLTVRQRTYSFLTVMLTALSLGSHKGGRRTACSVCCLFCSDYASYVCTVVFPNGSSLLFTRSVGFLQTHPSGHGSRCRKTPFHLPLTCQLLQASDVHNDWFKLPLPPCLNTGRTPVVTWADLAQPNSSLGGCWYLANLMDTAIP